MLNTIAIGHWVPFINCTSAAYGIAVTLTMVITAVPIQSPAYFLTIDIAFFDANTDHQPRGSRELCQTS